jgi:hypothetical protein
MPSSTTLFSNSRRVQRVRPASPEHSVDRLAHLTHRILAVLEVVERAGRRLYARIAESLESQFAEMVENQPELLARHCTEAGLAEKGAALWGKAGVRSLERSAFVESAE